MIPGTSKKLNIVAMVLILTLTGEIIWIKNTDNFQKKILDVSDFANIHIADIFTFLE